MVPATKSLLLSRRYRKDRAEVQMALIISAAVGAMFRLDYTHIKAALHSGALSKWWFLITTRLFQSYD